MPDRTRAVLECGFAAGAGAGAGGWELEGLTRATGPDVDVLVMTAGEDVVGGLIRAGFDSCWATGAEDLGLGFLTKADDVDGAVMDGAWVFEAGYVDATLAAGAALAVCCFFGRARALEVVARAFAIL